MTSATAAETWQGSDLRRAFQVASAVLDQHRAELNALNVFPVPDGDTGTNMALTLHGALEAMQKLPPDAAVATVARTMAHGSLMGARGNSGVILSQFLRGVATAFNDTSTINAPSLQAALTEAANAAYDAVDQPVEGTMLSVIRAAANGATVTRELKPNLQDVLDGALAAARAALARTTDQLDILRQAGVVDAGGQGIVHLLDGIARSARGETIAEAATQPTAGQAISILPNPAFDNELHLNDDAGYCTNFMVYGDGIDVPAARSAIGAMGDSVVVVGDATLLKIHVHTHDPLDVLVHAARLGALDQIRIDDMNRQREAVLSARTSYEPAADAPISAGFSAISIVAVAPGAGIGDALRSLGANVIVPGGHGINPSMNELLCAVESTSTDRVILLPNNGNVLPAAREVNACSTKNVQVVPTATVPAGLAALSAFNLDLDLGQNVQQMENASSDVVAISVTTAVRDSAIDGLVISQGQRIGLLDDQLVAAGDSDIDVVRQVMASSGIMEPELITVFAGEDVSAAEQDMLTMELTASLPESSIETHPGGQSHYRYIISVE